jgi:hypothetical protein
MFFRKDEKVFSLSGTSSIVLTHDISRLWSEFYSYLLIAGFYQEGEPCGEDSFRIRTTLISDPQFQFTDAAYDPKIGKMIAVGLTSRFNALVNHRDVTDSERNLLGDLNGLFSPETKTYYRLSAEQIHAVAIARNFVNDDLAIAHYVAQTYGQVDFLNDATLPRLYISLFGNIHLSNDDKILVTKPSLIYNSLGEDRIHVTALWSFFSTLTEGLSEFDYPANVMCDMLSSFLFVSNNSDAQKNLTVPKVAASLYMESLTGVSVVSRNALPARFYQVFLYGHQGNIDISRKALLNVLLDVMVKKMGDTRRSHMFPSGSIYRKLGEMQRVYGREPRRSYILDYALEALDEIPSLKEDPADSAEPVEEEDNPSTPTPLDKDEDTKRLPSTKSGGFDPSVSHPSSPLEVMDDEDTIGLISFDKTGEGVNEDLYRMAVVALNDRFKSDDSISVAADVKDALNFWVNGYLYRTAISATKERIVSLKLQVFLKNISI